MNFWIGRIAQALFALFAVSILAFLFLELAPGDYLDRMRLSPQISQETLEAMRVQYGLDRPFVERYRTWLGAVVTGTWGFSFAYGIAVAPLVWGRAINTLVLGTSAAAVAWALALPVGVWWATRRSTAVQSMGFLTSVILGFPELILGLTLLVLAERSGAFPIGGMRSIGADDLSTLGRARDLLWHLVLPVTTLALPAFAVLVRHVKAAVEDGLIAPPSWDR